MDRILVEIKEHIAIVTFNRPDKMNALDKIQLEAIIDTAAKLDANPEVRVVILRGAGRAFCAGLDVMAMQTDSSLMDNSLLPRDYGITNIWQQTVWAWRQLQVPVIAAVHGVAVGGGLQIMLAADIKYITADTRLSVLEMKWGLIPDMAGTQLMRHSVRDDIIRELTYTNRMFSGDEAVKYGFATHISEDPFSDAMALAEVIAAKSPSAIVMAKRVLNEAPYKSVEEGFMLESEAQESLIKKKNQLEAIYSSLQKRPGNFDNFREERD